MTQQPRPAPEHTGAGLDTYGRDAGVSVENDIAQVRFLLSGLPLISIPPAILIMPSTSDVILQYPEPGGSYLCIGVEGLPVATPVQIAFVPPAAWTLKNTRELATAVENALRRLSATPAITSTACGGHPVGLEGCWAHSNPTTRKLLVLVGEGTAPANPPAEWKRLVQRWPGEQDGGRIIPVLHEPQKHGKWLPTAVSQTNAFVWTGSVGEAVGAILAAAGVVPEERRVFISYRRSQRDIADQLFDALTHGGFDVFLDRFRIPVGVDFEAYLEDELRDKAMVVVIESADILQSRWTVGEIVFAFLNRLGLFAVHLPGGVYTPLIWSRRVSASLVGGLLSDASLRTAIERIQRAHEEILTWRRRFIGETVHDALVFVGGSPSTPGADGVVRIGATPPYRITPVPHGPGLKDFHAADLARGGAEPVLIGPSLYRETIRGERIRWLAAAAGIGLCDESEVLQMARDIV